jgi:hypothetical protein
VTTKRRAQKLAGPTCCSVRLETWSEFIEEHKIEDATIAEYYALPRPRGADKAQEEAWRLSLVT